MYSPTNKCCGISGGGIQRVFLEEMIVVPQLEARLYTRFKVNALWEIFDSIGSTQGQPPANQDTPVFKFVELFLSKSTLLCVSVKQIDCT